MASEGSVEVRFSADIGGFVADLKLAVDALRAATEQIGGAVASMGAGIGAAMQELQSRLNTAAGAFKAAAEGQADAQAQTNRTMLTEQQRSDQQSLAEQRKHDQQSEAQAAGHGRKLVLQSKATATIIDQGWRNTFEAITRTFDRSITGMILGTTTLRQAVQSIGQTIVGQFVHIGVDILANWIKAAIGMTAATDTEGAKQIASMQAVHAAAGVMSMTSSIGSIFNDAARAAAAAFASIAAIPVIGPELAPGAAAAAYAETAAWAGAVVPFAAGGFDVPRDTLAYLHKDEMVLPAPLADAVRGMAAGGGGGAPAVHFHVNAMDAKGVRQFLRQHGNAVADSLLRVHRNFKPLPAGR